MKNQSLVGKPSANRWTLKTVRDRCDDVGDCWIWTQALLKGYPQATIDKRGGMLVRRWVYERAHGPIEPGMRIVASCGSKLCCNPRHLSAVLPGAVLRKSWESGARSKALHAARMRAEVRAGRRVPLAPKITQAIADQIRNDPRPTQEVVQEAVRVHGINQSHAYRIRRNEVWRDRRADASVFGLAGRML